MMKNMMMNVLMIVGLSGCGGYYSEYYHQVAKASPEKINKHKEPDVVLQPELPSMAEINNSDYILLGYSLFSSTFCGAVSLECAANTGKEHGADLVIVKSPTFINSNTETINVTRTATVRTNTSFDGDGRFNGDYSSGRFKYSGQSHSQSNITYTAPENVTYNYYSFGAYFLLRKNKSNHQ